MHPASPSLRLHQETRSKLFRNKLTASKANSLASCSFSKDLPTQLRLTNPRPPVVASVPDFTPDFAEEHAVRTPPAHEADQAGPLQFTLPSPFSDSVAQAFATRRAYGRAGKANHYEKPGYFPPFSAKRFIPEPEGLFGRAKEADLRDSHEAEVIWNIGQDVEVSVAAFQHAAIYLKDGNLAEVAEFFSAACHFNQPICQHVKERVDFFRDSIALEPQS